MCRKCEYHDLRFDLLPSWNQDILYCSLAFPGKGCLYAGEVCTKAVFTSEAVGLEWVESLSLQGWRSCSASDCRAFRSACQHAAMMTKVKTMLVLWSPMIKEKALQ